METVVANAKSQPTIDWPYLERLRMSQDQLISRSDFIGGSDANVILSGCPERLMRLWREKRGEEPAQDLSGNLPVMLGCWTEAFNRQWFEQCTQKSVMRLGEAVRCSRDSWRGCTLDGFVEETGAVWEAKHTSSFAKSDEVLGRYMPQLQHNMAVVGAERAYLSVLFGNSKWECFEVAADWLYQADLRDAERAFWECVRSGTPPAAGPVPPAPKRVGVREVCLQGSNSWAAASADWLETRHAAKRHSSAVAALKDLVEPDVSRAFGHGIEVKRSKAGALTIKELAE
jgi:predicted phage-related endonuclease